MLSAWRSRLMPAIARRGEGNPPCAGVRCRSRPISSGG
jgi:hypothetical protein